MKLHDCEDWFEATQSTMQNMVAITMREDRLRVKTGWRKVLDNEIVWAIFMHKDRFGAVIQLRLWSPLYFSMHGFRQYDSMTDIKLTRTTFCIRKVNTKEMRKNDYNKHRND